MPPITTRRQPRHAADADAADASINSRQAAASMISRRQLRPYAADYESRQPIRQQNTFSHAIAEDCQLSSTPNRRFRRHNITPPWLPLRPPAATPDS